MAQPSQVFPPWLSPTPVVITNAAGAPVATETSIEYIAPTYFGPSIPLGTLYSFGGTSEPATVILPGSPQTTTSAVVTSVTTTATPTTTSLTTTSATPSTFTTASSSSSSVSTSTSSSSPTSAITSSASSTLSQSVSFTLSSTASASSTGAVAPIGASSLTKGQLVGIIVASILAVIVSFVAAITLWLCLKGRRKRRSQFNTLPIDDDYFVVPPGGRLPGEGSPRHSGEESDPFLQRHSGAPSGEAAEAAAGGAVGGAALAGSSRAPRVPPPPVATNGSKSSGSTANTGSGSTNSNASGFGVLLDRPGLGFLPSMPEHEETGGQSLSPTDMARIQRESVLPDDENQYDENGEYTGAYAISQDPQFPPRLVEPSATTPLLGGDGDNPRLPFMTQPSYLSEKSSFGSQEEGEPSILTARRVKAEDLGPRTNSDTSAGPSHRASTGLLGALGLGGLANIGRLSWFRNLDSPRNSRAIATPDYTSDPLTEKDIETGRSAMLNSPRQADSFGARLRPGGGVGTLPDGTRPISNVSARSGASGGTLYHDAQSSLPGTPLLAPLPRALTPAEQPTAEHAWISNVGTSGTPPPPAYTDRPYATSSTPPPHHSSDPNEGLAPATDDILDMPAPAALDHFSSISSLKETPTGSSFGNNSTKPSLFPPPGLESTIRPIGWSSGDTATTASRGSFAGLFGLSSIISGGMGMGRGQGMERNGNDLSILVDDVLDEAPPDAEQGWRTISSAGSHNHGGSSLGGGMGPGGGDPGRRGTFGLFVPHNPNINSEQGSLHSMRSHFNPAASMHSSGSAPASRPDRDIRMDGSISSNSSRPSAHSVARSMGSGVSASAHSLLRTRSISEDERRKGSGGPISPALSAFGHHQQRTSSSGEHEHPRHPSSPLAMAATIGSPPTAHMSLDKTNIVRAMNSAGSAGSITLADTSFGTSNTVRPADGEGEDVGLLSPARTMSPPISVSSAPWAGGLDGDWQPTL